AWPRGGRDRAVGPRGAWGHERHRNGTAGRGGTEEDGGHEATEEVEEGRPEGIRQMSEPTATPTAKRRRKKGWYESVGDYGSTVAVFEDPGSKVINGRRIIYGELRNPATGKPVSRSLGRISREDAIKWAADQ